MKDRVHVPFTNDMLYDTFLGLMGIRATRYDSHSDLFGAGYDKMPEQLMTMYGNVWITDDKEGLEFGNRAIRSLTFPEDEKESQNISYPAPSGA